MSIQSEISRISGAKNTLVGKMQDAGYSVSSADPVEDLVEALDFSASVVTEIVNPQPFDNWGFWNPVNQRRVSGTITTTGYFIDRWKLADGSVTLASGGLTLNGEIQQILEFAPKITPQPVALCSDGTLIDGEWDGTTKTVAFEATGKTLVAVGDSRSLAYRSSGAWYLRAEPNYTEELAKCQRYQLVFDGHVQLIAAGVAEATTEVRISLPTPVTLRALPTIVMTNTFRAEGSSMLDITSLNSYWGANSNSVSLIATVSGATIGQCYLLRAASSAARLLLDSNL